MSGHSKWATIKHKKGAADKARGKLFAKLIRQVEVAAREGGGDPDSNPTLRTMFQKARDASVPLDTIERAIKRGTGDLDGVTYESVTYEGYAPHGVAVLIEVLTDNRNRTGSDVRSLMKKLGGSIAEPGAVAWQFALNVPQMTENLIILNLPHPNGLARELKTNQEQIKNSEYARNFQVKSADDPTVFFGGPMTPETMSGWVKDPAARAKYVEAFERSERILILTVDGYGAGIGFESAPVVAQVLFVESRDPMQ